MGESYYEESESGKYANWVHIKNSGLEDLSNVYDEGTEKRSLCVTRAEGRNTFSEEYATAQTNTAIITCTEEQQVCVSSVCIAGEGNAGIVSLDFATSTKKVFRGYISKTQHAHSDEMHITGAAGESLTLNSTTGTDKIFLIVNYRLLPV